MAAADCAGRRFAVACGVLSRCVKAEAAAAAAVSGKIVPPLAPPAASTMLLMPGADVAPDVREEEQAQQLTIMYGGRVVVFDDFPAESVAELVRTAARKDDNDVARHGGSSALAVADLLPVARKGSLQRFMEKRRGRLAAAAPYSACSSPAAKAGKEDGDAGCWLVLGTPGSGAAAR